MNEDLNLNESTNQENIQENNSSNQNNQFSNDENNTSSNNQRIRSIKLACSIYTIIIASLSILGGFTSLKNQMAGGIINILMNGGILATAAVMLDFSIKNKPVRGFAIALLIIYSILSFAALMIGFYIILVGGILDVIAIATSFLAIIFFFLIALYIPIIVLSSLILKNKRG